MTGAPEPVEPTGEALFLSQLELIERLISFVCARHHLPGADADDFASHVKLKLIEDDYGVFRKFRRRSALRTYLTTVIARLFQDYRNSAWGKWRPSAEAVRAGEVAILLERLTVRDRYGFEEACELMEMNHQVTVPRAELEAMAARLPSRVRRRFESEEALADVAADQRPLDEVVADHERAVTAARVQAALTTAMHGLDTQDRLICALHFHDGRKLVDIARLLRREQKGFYRHVDQLMKQLQAALKASGIDGAAALEIFENAAVSIDWRDDTEGTAEPRPSKTEGEQEWR
jgi:RNA polymerase sigma factor (sigma-70 family)